MTDFTIHTSTEQHVEWLAINYENACGYCVPAHTGLAKLDAVTHDLIAALRNGTSIADPKFEALRTFTVQVVQKRGWLTDDDVQALSTPVDAVFKKFAWEQPAATEVA